MRESSQKSNLKSYIIGFMLSIILTFAAYGMVLLHVNSYHEYISHEVLIPTIIILAFFQLIVQLVFFLHVLHESKPRWNLLFFIGTFGAVLLVVVMSIWIMDHLNHNMTPQDMTNYIIKDEGIHK